MASSLERKLREFERHGEDGWIASSDGAGQRPEIDVCASIPASVQANLRGNIMEINLRPLTLGEILDKTAQLYRTNFVLFAGIAAPYAAVALAIGLVSALLLNLYQSANQSPSATWQVQVYSSVSLILMMLVSNVSAAANNRAVAWVHLGEPATIGASYRGILPQSWRYLGLGALKLLIAWSPIILMYFAFQASYVYFQLKGVLPQPGEVPRGTPNPQALMFVAVSAGFFLLAWPLLIYAGFMALRYALALPASVVENLKPRAALKRSIALTKGARGRILALWVLVIVIEFIVSATTQAFFVAYTIRHHYHVPIGLRIAQQVVAFFTNTFVGPILAIGTTLFYYDQRVRKEGFDIEWMMAAAGLGDSAAHTGSPEGDGALALPVGMPELPPAADALSPGDTL